MKGRRASTRPWHSLPFTEQITSAEVPIMRSRQMALTFLSSISLHGPLKRSQMSESVVGSLNLIQGKAHATQIDFYSFSPQKPLLMATH